MNTDGVLRPVANVLLAYCDRQTPEAQEARRTTQPAFPWPKPESPMLAYLLGTTKALIETDGVDGALLWLATHAWFEGALDAIDHANSTRD